MRVVIIGSKTFDGDIGEQIPRDATELLIAGRRGVCAQAAAWADARGMAKVVLDEGDAEALLELADLVVCCGAEVRTEKRVVVLA